MSFAPSRAMIRHSSKVVGRATRRFESTTAKATEAAKNTASKASEKASEFQSRASEGLSKVSSSSGSALGGVAQSASSTLSRIGGRTGQMIRFVERQVPPTIYYARVGLELAKLVFQGQKMTPPPLSTFQSYFQRFLKSFRNPQMLFQSASKSEGPTPESILSSIRNMNAAQMATGGVILAEVLGFFTVGEMIGRMKVVGYRGVTAETHGH